MPVKANKYILYETLDVLSQTRATKRRFQRFLLPQYCRDVLEVDKEQDANRDVTLKVKFDTMTLHLSKW